VYLVAAQGQMVQVAAEELLEVLPQLEGEVSREISHEVSILHFAVLLERYRTSDAFEDHFGLDCSQNVLLARLPGFVASRDIAHF